MTERLAVLTCVLFGHRIKEFETDLYGLVFVCSRCGSLFETEVELAEANTTALIRERMLSREAMQAATNAVGYMDRTGGADPNGYVRYKPYDYAEGAITAALDAITGETA